MINGINLGTLDIDSKDPIALCDFYAEMLGWEKTKLYNCPSLHNEAGFSLLFLEVDDLDYVAPVWPEEEGKQQKQMHLDFFVDDLTTAVAQAEALGAVKTKEQFGDNYFVTLLDPDGHPFCLCSKE